MYLIGLLIAVIGVILLIYIIRGNKKLSAQVAALAVAQSTKVPIGGPDEKEQSLSEGASIILPGRGDTML